MTTDNGAQTIAWIGARALSSVEQIAAPKLRPIRIRAGALGDGLPHSDLYVSPQHRILVASKIAKRMFRSHKILVPAIKLIEMDGIDQVETVQPVVYVHLLLDAHEIILANGAPA